MRIARLWPLLEAAANTKRDSYLPIRDALTILADEWTNPDELGSGGKDDEDDDGDREDEDEEDDNNRDSHSFLHRELEAASVDVQVP